MKVTNGGDDNDQDDREDIPSPNRRPLVCVLVLRHSAAQVSVGKVTQEKCGKFIIT